MNNITINLSAEDRACLNRLTEALEGMAALETLILDQVRSLGTAPSAPEIKAQDTQKDEPANTSPEPEKPTQAKNEGDTAPEITVDDIRSKVLTLTGAGKKDEVRAIVKEYAEKVGDIPADKRAEVHKRLSALEG